MTTLRGASTSCLQSTNDVVRDDASKRVVGISFRFPNQVLKLCVGGGNAGGLCSLGCGGGRCLETRRSGPAAIAVTRVGDPLPHGLADSTSSCPTQPGMVACIDRLALGDTPDKTFPHFTALPDPNDYKSLCRNADGLCDGSVQDLQLAIDVDGNVLVVIELKSDHSSEPFDGLTVHDRPLFLRILRGLTFGGGEVLELPVARLVQFSSSVDAFAGNRTPIRLADGALASFAPDGVRLPPIFDPQRDPGTPGALKIFGSVDGQRSVLRVARRTTRCDTEPCHVRTCDGGPHVGESCVETVDCCDGREESACAGRCRDGAFDFKSRLSGIGPVVVSNPKFDAAALGAVSLAGSVQTPELNVFVVNEVLARKDLDRSDDLAGSVVVVQDHVTGEPQPLAAPVTQSSSCGGARSLDGRLVTRVQVPPFTFSALAVEHGALAFLEPESKPTGSGTDLNCDGDRSDAILRVYSQGRRDGAHGSLDALQQSIAVDASPMINHRSLALSDGLVFARTPEGSAAPPRTRRISEDVEGVGGDGDSMGPAFSRRSVRRLHERRFESGRQHRAWDVERAGARPLCVRWPGRRELRARLRPRERRHGRWAAGTCGRLQLGRRDLGRRPFSWCSPAQRRTSRTRRSRRRTTGSSSVTGYAGSRRRSLRICSRMATWDSLSPQKAIASSPRFPRS